MHPRKTIHKVCKADEGCVCLAPAMHVHFRSLNCPTYSSAGLLSQFLVHNKCLSKAEVMVQVRFSILRLVHPCFHNLQQ